MAEVLDAHAIEGFVEAFLIDTFEERRAIAPCHRAWWEMVTLPDQQVVFAAPRGHAKSTNVNHAYGLAAALFQFHPFQLKVSKTYALACEKLEQAKQELLTNEKLRRVFRLKRLIREREDDFIAEMTDGYKFRMMALGMQQATRGRSWGTMRPTLIQLDDAEDDEEVMNRERRDKAMAWFLKTLLPMGGEKTQIRVYGTVLHADSLLMRLINMKSWRSGVWEACDETVSEESILWPEKFPRERLLQIKQTYIDAGNLAAFNMEYRNIAFDTSSGYFRKEDFIGVSDDELNDKRLTYYVGGDFAISTKERRDYTVFFVAGLDEEGFLYVVDLYRGRWDGNQIIDEMLGIERAYAPAQWFVESGAILKALGPAIELRMRAEGETGLYMNLVPMIPTKDKEARARSIQARMRGRGVRWRKDAHWYPDLVDEFLQFPRGNHDDMIDAAAHLGMGLAKMVTPVSEDDELDFEYREARREAVSFGHDGRSSITGY